MKTKLDQAILDSMSRNTANWKGVFYFNPKDPRLTVPKLNPSLGCTFNFASPYPYLTIVCVVIIIVAANYFF